VRERWPPSQTH